jgi:hypothetical protein
MLDPTRTLFNAAGRSVGDMLPRCIKLLPIPPVSKLCRLRRFRPLPPEPGEEDRCPGGVVNDDLPGDGLRGGSASEGCMGVSGADVASAAAKNTTLDGDCD